MELRANMVNATGCVNVTCNDRVTGSAEYWLNITSIKMKYPILNVTKTATPTNVMIGGTVNFTITIQNIGNTTAYNLNITDVLPDNFAMFSNSTNCLSDLSPGAVCTLNITATVGDNASFGPNNNRVIVTAKASTGDTVAGYANATVTVSQFEYPSFSVIKTTNATNNTIEVGGSIEFTINVTN
ncbi:MAG: hypothetical protein CVT88_09065, partial [Candidatus Altiarchaeales archaeon HGW-Altiarchaeales-1]